MTTDEILTHLRSSRTDLARLIEAASRDDWPCVVVSAKAVEAWQLREPHTWAMVRMWLESQGKSLVIV
jgi:hypothetical protein